MAVLISWSFGASGGGALFGLALARAREKQETSPTTRTLSSAPKRRTKPSSSKALPKKSKTAPFGSNSHKSITRNTAGEAERDFDGSEQHSFPRPHTPLSRPAGPLSTSPPPPPPTEASGRHACSPP